MPAISAARKAAFAVLMGVERGQSHSDDLLRGKAVSALSAPDRNLATTLVLGVIRNQIRIDHELQALLKRPNGKLDREVLIALRLGAFQLLYLDRIPARAAIDESVELANQAGHKFAARMVNAVLRKLAAALQAAEQGKAVREKLDACPTAPKEQGSVPGSKSRLTPRGNSPADFLSLWEEASEQSPSELALAESHPAWLVERWASLFGMDAARAICRHGQSQPTLTMRLIAPGVEAELAKAGIKLAPGEILAAARTVTAGDVTTTAAFKEGRIRFQDEGSQLVAEIAGYATAGAPHAILDCCAAPGGKTLILAERNPQAHILACESSPPRLAQLQTRLAPHAGTVECRLADATALTEASVFDLALADVPCSGTGTLGRNPEIRHRLHLEDLPRQAERQRTILAAALRSLRPGGFVVYSTCSLEPEENEQVVAAVLAEDANARQISIESRLASLLAAAVLTSSGAHRLRNCLTQQGAIRLMPGDFHTDGFFIALIGKTA